MHGPPCSGDLSPEEWICTQRTTVRAVELLKGADTINLKALFSPRLPFHYTPSPFAYKETKIPGKTPSTGALTPVLGCNEHVAVLP